jgi:hypothetical protein
VADPQERVAREVRALHELFVGWFSGALPDVQRVLSGHIHETWLPEAIAAAGPNDL